MEDFQGIDSPEFRAMIEPFFVPESPTDLNSFLQTPFIDEDMEQQQKEPEPTSFFVTPPQPKPFVKVNYDSSSTPSYDSSSPSSMVSYTVFLPSTMPVAIKEPLNDTNEPWPKAANDANKQLMKYYCSLLTHTRKLNTDIEVLLRALYPHFNDTEEKKKDWNDIMDTIVVRHINNVHFLNRTLKHHDITEEKLNVFKLRLFKFTNLK